MLRSPSPPMIVEMDVERDRKTCISLFAHITGASRELGQWLLDHPRYSGKVVAEWLNCSESRIRYLRIWAKKGFPGGAYRGAPNRRDHGDGGALETKENLSTDIETASPEEIKMNVLDSIERQKAVARAYKKIFAASKLDQVLKDEVSDAIGALITAWQSLQRALAAKGGQR